MGTGASGLTKKGQLETRAILGFLVGHIRHELVRRTGLEVRMLFLSSLHCLLVIVSALCLATAACQMYNTLYWQLYIWLTAYSLQFRDLGG